MNSEIKKVLEKIEKNGFEAYIVGGFVRDYLLCRGSNDVDICTNALPKSIKEIFKNSKEMSEYGSLNIKTNAYNYDITTYRQEIEYKKRHPCVIEYTSNLLVDLNRRDFTINAICMNQLGKIIDPLNGVEDLENRKIKMIGNISKKLSEDPLRILRAVRFATVLDFEIDSELWQEMIKHAKDIKTLSNYRLKKELDFLLLSEKFQKGFDLLNQLGILELFDIKINHMVYVNDLSGMWAQLKTTHDFHISNIFQKEINKIKQIINEGYINELTLFTHDLYPSLVASTILNIKKEVITEMYQKMPIRTGKDLAITFQEIESILKTDPKSCERMKQVLIRQVLNKTLKNETDELRRFIKER